MDVNDTWNNQVVLSHASNIFGMCETQGYMNSLAKSRKKSQATLVKSNRLYSKISK